MKILLAEDEDKIAASVRDFLTGKGFNVDWASNGKMAIEMSLKKTYDAAVVDLRMPEASGFEVCGHLRKTCPSTGVIVLTAYSQIEDKLEAFRAGADDYLTKPFHLDELLVRLESILRRSKPIREEDEKLAFAVLDFEMDFKKKSVRRAGKTINLSVKEYNLLEYLVQNYGMIMSKNAISQKVWEINFETGTNTIEVYINFLRNKIDKEFPVKLIHTKTGFGYYFKDESSDA